MALTTRLVMATFNLLFHYSSRFKRYAHRMLSSCNCILIYRCIHFPAEITIM